MLEYPSTIIHQISSYKSLIICSLIAGINTRLLISDNFYLVSNVFFMLLFSDQFLNNSRIGSTNEYDMPLIAIILAKSSSNNSYLCYLFNNNYVYYYSFISFFYAYLDLYIFL